MIASSEEPLPQSGLGGVYNRLLAGTGPRTSPREPAPSASVPRRSPADLPPRRSWRPRGPPCEEVAALRVGRDDGGAGGRGAGCAADGRGGREGGAAALGGGGLKTWEIKKWTWQQGAQDIRGVQDEQFEQGAGHLGSKMCRPLPVQASAVEAWQHLQITFFF